MELQKYRKNEDQGFIDRVEKFVRESTSPFDASHDYSHAVEVTELALKIADAMDLSCADQRLVYLASMVHDVVDHKYKDKSISEDERDWFVRAVVSCNDAELVVDIVDNISFSKEKKNRCLPDLGKRGNMLRNIVSDADKLTALGLKGIERCKEYTKMIKPGQTNHYYKMHVISHCHEKLLGLSDYIYTDEGKRLAAPLQQELADWVIDNSGM